MEATTFVVELLLKFCFYILQLSYNSFCKDLASSIDNSREFRFPPNCNNIKKRKLSQSTRNPKSVACYLGGILSAPSNRMTSPFNMWFVRMEITNCPNSSGFPNRDGQGTVAPSSFLTASGRFSSRGVSKRPGAWWMQSSGFLLKSFLHKCVTNTSCVRIQCQFQFQL